MTRDDLRSALQSSNVQAFLRVIRAGETSHDDSAYTTMFGGGHFASFSDHPRSAVTRGRLTSTAAGAYQFLEHTWDGLVKQYGFPDFSPGCQDEACVALIAGRHALPDLIAGHFQTAVALCCREWASLPGSPYGQPTRTYAQALATYTQYGGALEPASQPAPDVAAPLTAAAPEVAPQPKPEPTMPFLIPALSAIMQAIPMLQAKWGGDASAVATRNVALATTVVDAVKAGVGAVNEQELVEKLQSDPAAVQAAHAAVQDIWWQIDTSGMAAAREADAKFAASGIPVWRSPSFLAALLLTPIVYMIVGAMVGLYGTLRLSPEVTASIITGIVTLIIGGASGYYWGSATTANKPAPAAATQ